MLDASETKSYEKGGEDDTGLEPENKALVLEAMVAIYVDVQALSQSILTNTGRVIYSTPAHFEHFCRHYEMIYREQEEKLKQLIARFEHGLAGLEKSE